MILKKCPKCKTYTLKKECKKCQSETASPHYKFLRLRDAPNTFKRR